MAVEPSSSNTIQVQSRDVRFPPFPLPPDGVTIIPFKDFKPNGIQLFAQTGEEEDVELDGLGIPTVELRVKHETDDPKSNGRKRRKKKKVPAEPGKKIPWYEEWEEGEHLRIAKSVYDRSFSRIDRFFQASTDFKTGRKWPNITYGLNILWDEFRLFVGLISTQPKFRKPNKHPQDSFAVPLLDVSDDEKAPALDSTADNIGASRPSESKKRRRGNLDLAPDFDDDDDEPDDLVDMQNLGPETEVEQEEKLNSFLDDPETSIKIFLSSYMREKGLVWSEKNLDNTPRLLEFFINFVLRNRVLPESSHEQKLRKALEVVELAKAELPSTFKIGQTLPDAFSMACLACWGKKAGLNTWQAFEVDATLQRSGEDNMDVTPGNTDAAHDTNSGWGNTADSGWASADADPSAGWGSGGDISWNDDPGDDGSATTPALVSESIQASWDAPTTHSLLTFLGPTLLPLTHATGIVESSTRRIKAIFPIPETLPSSGKAIVSEPNPEVVEEEFDRMFAKVVLTPWVTAPKDNDDGDITSPTIMRTSRGAVVVPETETAGEVNSERKPHDPYKDDIVLLVEPSVLEKMRPGMGISAFWIQIVRQESLADNSSSGNGVKTKKKKKGKKGANEELKGNYWYMEDLSSVFPSFFTANEKEV